MGRLQRLILALVPPSWAASMERDSRGWKLVCPCGHARSVWDAGGIRWKAVGEPRKLLRCPACGGLHWHRTTWRPDAVLLLVWAAMCLFASTAEPSFAEPSFAEPSFAEQAEAVRRGAATRIRVADRPLDDDEWQTLAGLEGLVALDLQEGVADDAKAVLLSRLPKLERLVLRESPLSDDGLVQLAACHTLRELNLPRCRCTRAGFEALAELPRLKSLRLGSPELCPEGKGGAELGAVLLRFPALKSLHLIDVPLGDEGLDALARYDGLWNLYLDGAGISDAAWDRYFALHSEVHVHVDQAHHDRDPNRHE